MKTLLVILFCLSAAPAWSQTFYVKDATGIYKSEFPGPWEKVIEFKPGDRWVDLDDAIPPKDDDPDPGDPPLNLADSIARIADGVNDPGPRGAIAAFYEIAMVSNETWKGAVEAAKQQRSAVLTLSTKAEQWKLAFSAMDALIDRVPPAKQNDDTLAEIVAALRRDQATLLADVEGAGGINWVKIITCLLSGIGGGAVIFGGWYLDRRTKRLGVK